MTFFKYISSTKKFQNNSRNSENSRTDSQADNTISHNTIFSWFTKWWLHSTIIFGLKDIRIQENYQNSIMIKVISPTKKICDHLTKFPDPKKTFSDIPWLSLTKSKMAVFILTFPDHTNSDVFAAVNLLSLRKTYKRYSHYPWN